MSTAALALSDIEDLTSYIQGSAAKLARAKLLAAINGALASAVIFSFTYRETGAAGTALYATFKDAVTAAIASGVHAQVVLDDSASVGACHSGVCGALDLTNVDIVGYAGSLTPVVFTFETGTTVTHWRDVVGVSMKSTSAGPVTLAQGYGAGATGGLTLRRSFVTGGAAADFISVLKTAAPFDYFPIFCYEQSALLNGTHRVCSAAASTYAFADFYQNSAVQNGAFGGAGETDLSFDSTIEDGNGNAPPMTQPNVTGPFSVTLRSLAALVKVADNAPVYGATQLQAMVDAMKARIAASASVGTYGTRPAAGTAGRTYYASDGGVSWVDDGAAWRPSICGILGNQPPLAAAFTVDNAAGGLAIADSNGGLILTGVTDGSQDFRGFGVAAASSVIACLSVDAVGIVNLSEAFAGVYLRNVAGPVTMCFGIAIEENTDTLFLEANGWNGGDIGASRTVADVYPMPSLNMPLFLRLRAVVNGGAIDAEIATSRDLFTWRVLHTYAGFFTGAAPARGGVGGYGFFGAHSITYVNSFAAV